MLMEGAGVALGVGALTALLVRPVLTRLPEPPDGAGKRPYADLVTPSFVLGCGLLAILGAGLAWLSLPRPVQPLWWVLGTLGLLLAAVDARTTWLPLRLTRVAWSAMIVAVVLAAAWAVDLAVAGRAVVGAALAGGLYLIVWLVSRGGFGFGDVRFAPLLGAPTAAGSWTLLLWALVLGTLLGGLQGVFRLVRGRRSGFAYAPAMLSGAFAACGLLRLTGTS